MRVSSPNSIVEKYDAVGARDVFKKQSFYLRVVDAFDRVVSEILLAGRYIGEGLESIVVKRKEVLPPTDILYLHLVGSLAEVSLWLSRRRVVE